MNQNNFDLINYNVLLLNRLVDLIDIVDQSKWTLSIKTINGESISRHMRHVYNFYECFLSGFDDTTIDYDARIRDESFEQDINYARTKLVTLISKFSNLDHKDRELSLFLNKSVSKAQIKTTLRRELMNLIDHSIHHGHIIYMGIKNEFPEIELKDEFYSPSTLESIKCAK